jgi:ribosome-associated translation inhibitor RaiA
MNPPLQITFRHMDSSPAVEERIREEAEQLSRYFDRIVSCHAVIEAPHPGHGVEYRVTLHLGVPGTDIVVNHAPPSTAAERNLKLDNGEKRRKRGRTTRTSMSRSGMLLRLPVGSWRTVRESCVATSNTTPCGTSPTPPQ